ncbi:hypothetical protein DXN05_13540 [Deminuibacter soli]|uniref:Uncharacterized protein n=1 Tax=Deminuibacter soli TaxID=2291815 RepID=A0A3E1NIH1_9BACT|nr:hypothetical protein DXN05_13540 [Deminuibacter soli]
MVLMNLIFIRTVICRTTCSKKGKTSNSHCIHVRNGRFIIDPVIYIDTYVLSLQTKKAHHGKHVPGIALKRKQNIYPEK